MAPAVGTADELNDGLMQFLYRAPIGLVQTTLAGDIEMINPMSANLLMPLSPDGGLDNLFVVLDPVAPQLRQLVAAFAAPTGVVCESLRIPLQPGPGSGAGGAASGGPGADHAGLPGAGAPQVLSISLMRLDTGRLMAVLSDATLDVQREQQGLALGLSAAARTDSLTHMPNRAALRERLAQALARRPGAAGPHGAAGPGFALLFMNCDRFMQINDRLGQAAGDELLGLLADRVRATLRAGPRASARTALRAGALPDARPGGHGHRQTSHAGLVGPVGQPPMAARVGGDEFVVLLDDLARPDDVHAVAQRLLDVLAQPYGLGQQQVHCSISMGIVLAAQAAQDADGVINDASIAMVEAKRAGGGCYRMFEPAMQARAAARGSIEAELRTALADGQLFVVYQPVVGLQAQRAANTGAGVTPFDPCAGAPPLDPCAGATPFDPCAGATPFDPCAGVTPLDPCAGGTPFDPCAGFTPFDPCAGVEALVRWRHPVRGVVGPLDFIGVAEQCGLIGALGDFVLSTACRQFVAWQRTLGARAPRLLAVNLSRAQLGQPGWVARVQALLHSTGMAPAQLQLEVTESLAAQDAAVQATLHALKALGLSLALDDFGTGYSSLASLHLLPVDVVKIDRSFVSQADSSAHHRVLIQATVRVAQSLGMATVAEGIETEAQAAVVRQLGCDKGQGYLFSKPLAADAVAGWLAGWPSAGTGTPTLRRMREPAQNPTAAPAPCPARSPARGRRLG